MKPVCTFCFSHNPQTLEPIGPICGKPVTQAIVWKDGRVSPSCSDHGLQALDEDARELVVRVVEVNPSLS